VATYIGGLEDGVIGDEDDNFSLEEWSDEDDHFADLEVEVI
jgi:polyribonucleotide nucleotidyltransferase